MRFAGILVLKKYIEELGVDVKNLQFADAFETPRKNSFLEHFFANKNEFKFSGNANEHKNVTKESPNENID